MTDNEIIKALEGMIQFANTVNRSVLDMVDVQTLKNTLDLINRLEAKCEELQGIIVKYYSNLCCEEIIKDPYEARMKEFYIDADYDVVCGILPLNSKNTTKIHLCENCYKGLKEIGGRVKSGEENNGKCAQIYCPNNKDGMCKYPLFGDCIISNCRNGKTYLNGTYSRDVKTNGGKND